MSAGRELDRLAGPGLRRARRDHRRRRHLASTGVVLAYLLAGGVTVAAGGGDWLALHLVLLGGVTNAIVVWSEHFAAALLHTRPGGARVALARLLALNLAVLTVLVGVHADQHVLLAGGAGLLAIVVLVHVAGLAASIRRGLAARLGDIVWFYVAAGTALIAGAGLGVLMGGGAVGSADGYLAVRLAHVHLNVLGWIGLSVIGTQFTLWPTVLRTRIVPGLRAASRWAFLSMVPGLGLAVAGLLVQDRGLALAGLAGYAAGLGTALVPFARTLLRRRPQGAAAWMLGLGTAWFALAVVADFVALLGASRVVELDGGLHRLVPVVVVGFGLQVLAGALTYLLPTVWGGGAHGNRRLTALLETGWPARVAALNLGVAVVAAWPAGGWVELAGKLLVGIGLGSFVVLAAVALAVRGLEEVRQGAEAR